MVESNTTLDTRLKEQIVLLANDNAGNQEMYEENIMIAVLQINTHSSYGNFFNFYEWMHVYVYTLLSSFVSMKCL